jgi:PEP-CTERM motif
VDGEVVRRRRTWYQRRRRNERILVASAAIVAIALFCWQSANKFFSAASTKGTQASAESFWAKAAKRELQTVTASSAKRRVYVARVEGVYPYSVVPGGVKSAQSLRQAAASDKAVARHFSQFDYNRAHLVRLTEPREVYVSYRIRDTVFWTKKRIRLQAGELLLTDGKTTARAKCGNQVSDTAKPEISDEEPEEDILDQPVALEPIGPALPLRAAMGKPELPSGQPIAPKLFSSNFTFPYAPVNLPLPPRNCEFMNVVDGKDCHHHKKPVAPEPSTMVLLVSGLAAIGWRYRRRKGVA